MAFVAVERLTLSVDGGPEIEVDVTGGSLRGSWSARSIGYRRGDSFVPGETTVQILQPHPWAGTTARAQVDADGDSLTFTCVTQVSS